MSLNHIIAGSTADKVPIQVSEVTIGDSNIVSDATSDYVLTIPAVTQDSAFIMSCCDQTVQGQITFEKQLLTSAASSQINMSSAQLVITAPTMSAATTYTIPDAKTNTEFVMADGAQAISGVKTFSSALTTSAAANQINLASAQLTINAPAMSAALTYTIPDSKADSSFVLSDGAQTINGTKTFTSPITTTATTAQIAMPLNNLTISAPVMAAAQTYNLPDVAHDADFVMTRGDQTIRGIKTFVDPIYEQKTIVTSATELTATANQLTFQSVGGNEIAINAINPAADRVYSIPDVLSNASFVLTAGAQSIGGAKTFTSPLTCTSTIYGDTVGSAGDVNAAMSLISAGTTAPQLSFTHGSSPTPTDIKCVMPSAARLYTIEDVKADASFIMSAGTQTLTGATAFSQPIEIKAASSQIAFSGVNTTVSVDTPESARVLTIPSSSTGQIVTTGGGQQFTDSMNFLNGLDSKAAITTTDLTVSGTAISNELLLQKATNQLSFTHNYGQYTTINAVAPIASRVYSIPDVGADSGFLMEQGNQFVYGLKSFMNQVQMNAGELQINFLAAQTFIDVKAGEDPRTLTIPFDAAGNFTFSGSDPNFTNGLTSNFVTTPLLTVTGNARTFGVQTVDTSITINGTSNQIRFPSALPGFGAFISVPPPSAARVYTLADPGSDASFIMSAGAQSIGGAKSFSSQVAITASANQLLLNNATITASASSPQTYTIPNTTSASFVMASGNQTISGTKTFTATIVSSATTNQLALNTTTVTAPVPAAARVYTIPDATIDTEFLMRNTVPAIQQLPGYTQVPQGGSVAAGATTTIYTLPAGRRGALYTLSAYNSNGIVSAPINVRVTRGARSFRVTNNVTIAASSRGAVVTSFIFEPADVVQIQNTSGSASIVYSATFMTWPSTLGPSTIVFEPSTTPQTVLAPSTTTYSVIAPIQNMVIGPIALFISGESALTLAGVNVTITETIGGTARTVGVITADRNVVVAVSNLSVVTSGNSISMVAASNNVNLITLYANIYAP